MQNPASKQESSSSEGMSDMLKQPQQQEQHNVTLGERIHQ